MAEVWFIRHGESMSNAGHMVARTETTPLTPKGHEQALAVCKAITKTPDLIIITPYLRTFLTAIPTMEKFPLTRHEIWPLHEFPVLNRHAYTGTTKAQREPMMAEYWKRMDPDYVDGMGAESFSGVVARITENLKRLQSMDEGFITVFSHGYILRILYLMLEYPHYSAKELMTAMHYHVQRTHIDNGSIIRVTADPAGIRLNEEDRLMLQIEGSFSGLANID